MAKTLYFYSLPNDANSDTMRSGIQSSAIPFTEIDTSTQNRVHNVSIVGRALIVIDVDGRIFRELVHSQTLSAEWAAAPDTLPPPQMTLKQIAINAAMDSVRTPIGSWTVEDQNKVLRAVFLILRG